jgi:hypothetical protein
MSVYGYREWLLQPEGKLRSLYRYQCIWDGPIYKADKPPSLWTPKEISSVTLFSHTHNVASYIVAFKREPFSSCVLCPCATCSRFVEPGMEWPPYPGQIIGVMSAGGIYAFKDEHLISHDLGPHMGAFPYQSTLFPVEPIQYVASGRVELWGKMIEHELGYRSEYARVDSLTIPIARAYLRETLSDLYQCDVEVQGTTLLTRRK